MDGKSFKILKYEQICKKFPSLKYKPQLDVEIFDLFNSDDYTI